MAIHFFRSKVKLVRDDQLQSEVVDQALSEIKVGRMSPFVSDDLSGVVTRRFSVIQRSSKGQTKVRIVDDFKESGINSFCFTGAL